MKVTLRNIKTGEFFAGAGRWVSSPQQAQNFGYSDLAEDLRDQLGTPDINIFYIFNRSQAVRGPQ